MRPFLPVRSCFYLLPVLFILLSGTGATAQTTLATGDISFTGYNSNNSGTAVNNFSFIILRPGGITANTVISFTDCGYNSLTGKLQTSTGDGVISWQATADLAQFTEVNLKAAANGTTMETVSAGYVGSITGTFILSPAGDQVIAYQGTFAAPTFIAGIHMNFEPLTGTSPRSDSLNWDNLRASGGVSFNENRSAFPPGMSYNASFFGPATPSYTEYDNAVFKCPADSVASVATFKTSFFITQSWDQRDLTTYPLPASCNLVFKRNPTITQPTNKVVCPGANTSFGIITDNAGAYQWQVNDGNGFTDISNGGIYSGATTKQVNLTGVTAAMNGYQYRCLVVSASDNTVALLTNAATLTTNAQTWQGNTSNAWNNSANWTCSSVPTALNTITIPSGRPNQPAIPSGAVSVNTITINSGASVTIAAGATLDIKGNFTNNGTLTANGTVSFSGTNQTIPAGTFNNLVIDGGGTKTITGNVIVNGVLTLTNGYVQLNNNSLGISAGGSITGGSNTSFIVTGGTGTLNQDNVGNGGKPSVVFPVGSTASSSAYNPVTIANAGTPDQFRVRVTDGINTAYDAGEFTVGNPLTVGNVNKTWLIAEAIPGGSDATLTFQWSASDEQPGFMRNDAYVGHYTGGQWTTGPLNQVSSGADPYTLSLSNVTSFSPFGVGSQGSILPLELLSFSGKLIDHSGFLQWTTAHEQALLKFIIERSRDGITYAGIGEVAAVNGPDQYSYSFTDKTVTGNQYYRLKCVDIDGHFIYSRILLLVAGDFGSRDLSFHPNPVKDMGTLHLELSVTKRVDFRLVDAFGTVIRRWQKLIQSGSTDEPVKLGGLPAGTYYLVLNAEGTTKRIRIVKM
jgi:hypothetical protein